jgi:adenosylcobinamide kinase/adenosylcobinamide-phosphate guanylyltransferase
MIHLVIGGARSGKSRFALEQVMQLSETTNLPVTFVATATASDPEMAQRIAYHEAERPEHWRLAEVPMGLNLLLAETECGFYGPTSRLRARRF